MNKSTIAHVLGNILKIEAGLLLIPLIVSFIYKENNYYAFLIPIGILLVFGFLLTLLFKRNNSNLSSKDGFIIVGLSWIFMSLFGSIPYMISGEIPTFINALFETVSGFTTTGASIMSNQEIDSMSYSIGLYRSLTHFIGGMGVLVFVIAILPKSNIQNIYVLKAESTGPQVGKLTSKIKNTAIILYIIYVVLTALETVLLVFDKNNDLFLSITTAFSTAGTGGFSVLSTSIASMSEYSQIVVMIFMALFGINFNIFFLIILGKFFKAFKNEELIAYVAVLVVASISITVAEVINSDLDFGKAWLESSFHAVSFMTSTGFSNGDFLKFTNFSKVILFTLMFVGACSGSTGGGFKVSRLVILSKCVKREVSKVVHPNRVESIKLDGEPLEVETERSVLTYFVSMMFIIIISLLLVSTSKNDFETNLSCVVSCINNVGLAFGNSYQLAGSFNIFNSFSKVILIILMLIGRLELYPILVLFDIRTWKNK